MGFVEMVPFKKVDFLVNFSGMAGGVPPSRLKTRMPKWYQDEQKELHASKGGAHRSNSGYFWSF